MMELKRFHSNGTILQNILKIPIYKNHIHSDSIAQ